MGVGGWVAVGVEVDVGVGAVELVFVLFCIVLLEGTFAGVVIRLQPTAPTLITTMTIITIANSSLWVGVILH